MDPRSDLVVPLPTWVDEIVLQSGTLMDDDSRMDLVVRLAQMNTTRGGGPFGAAVFLGERCVAAAVNQVLESGLSIAHAEVLALMRAQQILRSESCTAPYTLVTSTEPCCQCFGAILWSAAERLVSGAFTEDAEAVGFDEGPKPLDWPLELERRGIAVTRGVRRDSAKSVLEAYRKNDGRLY